jgi:transposase
MISAGSATRIFLATGATDMRRGYDGLADLVRNRLQGEPLSGHWFVFCNQRRNRIKILYFDGTGLWQCAKRLEKGSFSWPEAAPDQTSVRLSGEELALLLGGIELERTRAKNWWRKERKDA